MTSLRRGERISFDSSLNLSDMALSGDLATRSLSLGGDLRLPGLVDFDVSRLSDFSMGGIIDLALSSLPILLHVLASNASGLFFASNCLKQDKAHQI